MWPLLKGLQKTLLRAVVLLSFLSSTETFPFPGTSWD